MELQIKDRLYLPAFFAEKGTFKQFNIKKEILRKIEIGDAEREEIGLKKNEETERIEWNIERDTPLNVDFSADELEYLKQSCEKMSDENLPDDMWSTIEKVFDSIDQ